MICVDTNVIVYISKGLVDPGIFRGHHVAFSSITKIEALGYGKLTQQEAMYLEVFFNEYQHWMITDSVVEQAIQLRVAHRIGLADAIIAATALDNDGELWTANTADFTKIEGLKLKNPLSAAEIKKVST